MKKTKRPAGYWKKYYSEHRKQRISESCLWQKKNKAMREKYMQEYREKNPEKWKLDKEQLAKRQMERRQRYSSDPEFRKKTIELAKLDRIKHPTRRANNALKKYGSRFKTYEEAVKSQNGKCAICGKKEGDGRGYRLHIDHCHITNKYRGMLCSDCNLGLGKLGDTIEAIERAAKYLRSHYRQAVKNCQDAKRAAEQDEVPLLAEGDKE